MSDESNSCDNFISKLLSSHTNTKQQQPAQPPQPAPPLPLASQAVRESALHYMCLHVNEEDLPIGFDPSTSESNNTNNIQVFDSRKQKESSNSSSSSSSSSSSLSSQYDSLFDSLFSKILYSYGWDKQTAYRAYQKIKSVVENITQLSSPSPSPSYKLNIDTHFYYTVYLLLRLTTDALQGEKLENKSTVKDFEVELSNIIVKNNSSTQSLSLPGLSVDAVEELETLSAIFYSNFQKNSLKEELAATLSLPETELEIIDDNFILVSIALNVDNNYQVTN